MHVVYRCKYFKIHELVPEELYAKVMTLDLGCKDEESIKEDMLWSMFDPDVLIFLDWVKVEYSLDKPVTVNNWYWGGNRNWSGFRTKDSPYYSETSQHSKGCGIDAKFKDIDMDQLREDICSRKDLPCSIRLEKGVSWLHMDTKPVAGLPEKTAYAFWP